MRCVALKVSGMSGRVSDMKSGLSVRQWLVSLLMLMAAPAIGEPPAGATAAFDAYVGVVEGRIARQHGAAAGFLAPEDEERLRRGEMVIEKLGGKDVPGALLHHWRGSAFVPGATGIDFDRLMRDFGDYPKRFAPQVLQTKVLADHGNHYQVLMRVKQKHVITVVMDTAYDVSFGKLDAAHGYSTSRSTRVTEIADAGTPQERALGPDEEHGFLWRQNTYWAYEERDGGLYVQLESVSLSRGVPRGLGWAVGPYVQSVPRDSLEFTLGRVRDALKR
jgi:hypothetical protein